MGSTAVADPQTAKGLCREGRADSDAKELTQTSQSDGQERACVSGYVRQIWETRRAPTATAQRLHRRDWRRNRVSCAGQTFLQIDESQWKRSRFLFQLRESHWRRWRCDQGVQALQKEVNALSACLRVRVCD